MSQYDLSRKKYSSLAIAAICTVLQDAHNDMHEQESDDMFMVLGQEAPVSEMQEVRDTFLTKICERFGDQIDLDEIYEILRAFKQPFQ